MKKVNKTKVTARPVNRLFPGRPNYKGPQRGWFAFVHHSRLYEKATEDMSYRVEYIRSRKPKDEVAIRLRHLIYLGRTLSQRCEDESYVGSGRRRTGSGRRQTRLKVLAYVKKHIKPLRWSEDACTLTMTDGTYFTG